MGFEKFEKGSFRGASSEQITLRKSGGIGISKSIVEQYFEDHDGVVLYFDEENSKVGLEPADPDEDPNAYSMNDSGGSGSIQATSFLKRHDLVPEETTPYEPEWDDEHEFVVIDLDEPKA